MPVSNCTSALHLSLLCSDIGHGDEVLVPDYTFPSTALSVLYCGARPIFVDVERDTYNLDPVDLQAKITRRSKAVIPVHHFGLSADMDSILDIAYDKRLHVIEDAACSLGAMYKSKMTGTMGDYGCFSFHARKIITTGEGGAVVTSNKKSAEKIRSLLKFGMKAIQSESKVFVPQKFFFRGYNFKMSDINASLGVVQLKKISAFIKERRSLAEYYNRKLKKLDGITLPVEKKYRKHIYQSYVIVVNRDLNRNSIIESLRKKGIDCTIGTYACSAQPVFKSKKRCQVAKGLYEHSIALPLYNGLSHREIDLVVSKLGECINESR